MTYLSYGCGVQVKDKSNEADLATMVFLSGHAVMHCPDSYKETLVPQRMFAC